MQGPMPIGFALAPMTSAVPSFAGATSALRLFNNVAVGGRGEELGNHHHH